MPRRKRIKPSRRKRIKPSRRKQKETLPRKFLSLFLIASTFVLVGSTSYWFFQPQPESPSIPSFQQEDETIKHEDRAVVHKNCLARCPSGTAPDNILVDHDTILLSSNRNTKFADWVAYLVTSHNIKGPKRERNWARDPKIDVRYTFIPSDYKGMGLEPYFFDRGHQAPLASFKNHPKWHTLNYLSNITPQKKGLNRGPWKDLESAERKLVGHYSTTYVLTGPYYDKNNPIKGPSLGRIQYRVPSGYWKIIAVKDGEGMKTVSFIFSQDTPLRAPYCKHLSSVSDIEKKTGLVFFGNSPTLRDQNLIKRIGCVLQLDEIKTTTAKPKKYANMPRKRT